MDLKQKANEFGFVSKIKLVHENLKSPDMGDLDKLLYYLWLCELQKWLREKFMIIPEVNAKWYNYKISGYSLKVKNTYYKEHYNTYEKALENGLQEVLKLI